MAKDGCHGIFFGFTGILIMFTELYTVPMKKLLTVVTALTAALYTSAAKSDELRSILNDLDNYIENSDIYVQQKQERIDLLRQELEGASFTKEYEINYGLFEEYQSFRYDSAYFYANRSLELARQMNDQDKMIRSRCAIVFCYMSSGLFLEAFDEMKKVDASDASLEVRKEYYSLYNRLYYDASDFNNTEHWSHEYTRLGTLYADSLMAIVPKESYDYTFAVAQCEIKHWHYKECIDFYKTLLEQHKINDHNKAIIHSSIGGAYKVLGQTDSSMIYLAKAAIYDILSATKETTALYRLAEMLCEEHPDRAYTYIHTALADADFYNARHRKLSINPILPIIEKARIDAITKQRNQIGIITILCFLMLAMLVTVFIVFRKQHKKLQKKSRQLQEANRIKDEYIGNSFYANAEFLSEVEEMYKTINQKLTARQYEDLRDISKLSKVNKRRESMHESFDKCFLNIFPSFISEYASLFPEGYIDPKANSLTSEMRIFALIRLGITDSERISKFLNYSVHTIYTYKTRAKTKSIVDNDEFEKRIKAVEIG